VKAKKPRESKAVSLADEKPKIAADQGQRVFGSAKGQIVFKKGWEAPMTKREFDEFLGGSSLV
jgi:hypothetical protein